VPGIGIQLGKGDGTFHPVVPFPTGVLTGSSVIGDFNGDTKLDIAVIGADSTGQQLQILFSNGDGTFRAGSIQSLPASDGLGDLVAADLNGDGKLDLVGSTGSAAQVFIGKGDGTFTPGNFYNAPTVLPTGIIGSTSIVVADFNGDKKKDVAAFNTMLLGNGDGTLQGNPAVPGEFIFRTMGDFNGEGHPDFAGVGDTGNPPSNPNVFQANLNIWLNDGKNNFTLAHTYAINIPFPNLADSIGTVFFGNAADVNGDGKIDLVGYLWDASGLSMIVLLGNGDGSFGAPIATRVNSDANHQIAVAFTVGDVNGDGKLDLLVNAGIGAGPLTFYLLLGKGDGTFAAPIAPFVGGSNGTPVVGDFNNDKKLDVIMGTANGIGVLLGNGDGTFQPTTFISNSACATACGTPVSADFNGDGKLDLMFEAGVSGYQVLLGKGDGTFTISPAVAVPAGTFGGVFQVADFNGDGKPDVLGSIGSLNPSLGLILGNGDGTFGSPHPVTNAGFFPFVADFNSDSKLDILEVGANQLVWLFNNGQAVVPPQPDFSLGSGSGAGTATVSAGSTATYLLSLSGSGGFVGTVALKCSVAPAGPACSVSPSSVMVSGSTAATATVSVTTTARSGLLPIGDSNERDTSRKVLWIFGVLLVDAGIIRLLAGAQMRPRRFSWSLAMACGAILFLAATLISGCGGGSNSSSGSTGSSGTTAGNYTVTVTAQSGSVSHQTKLTLTVQ
jgi:hypothetical protein